MHILTRCSFPWARSLTATMRLAQLVDVLLAVTIGTAFAFWRCWPLFQSRPDSSQVLLHIALLVSTLGSIAGFVGLGLFIDRLDWTPLYTICAATSTLAMFLIEVR